MTRRVLVVEDEATLRALFRRRAEHAGLSVLEASTRSQAIALAPVERPDLILLDLHLPDGSGLQLIQQLRADPRTTSIPIIAWSGGDAANSEAEVLRVGAAAYFEKRDLKGLVHRIVELIRGGFTE